VAKHPEKLSIEYQDTDGTWKAMQVDADNPKASIRNATRMRILRHDRGVRVDDRYSAPEGTPAATAQYDPEAGSVIIAVDTGTVQVPRKGRVVFGRREVRVEDPPSLPQ